MLIFLLVIQLMINSANGHRIFIFFLEKRLDIYFLELDYKLLSVLICLKLKFAGVALHDSYVMICDFYSNYGSFLDFLVGCTLDWLAYSPIE